MPRAHYFGFERFSGHFFQTKDGKSSLSGCQVDSDFIESWDALIDGGLLRNGRVPDQPDGRVKCVPAKGPWIAFVWWDRSGDKRGASNSGFYVHGFEWEDRQAAFEFACAQWPDVVARQLFPLQLVP